MIINNTNLLYWPQANLKLTGIFLRKQPQFLFKPINPLTQPTTKQLITAREKSQSHCQYSFLFLFDFSGTFDIFD